MLMLILAAAITATPANLPATFRAANCGDTITLAAGQYGAVNAPKLACPAAPLDVDASAARMTSLVIRSASGLTWRGGTVTGSGGGAAVTLDTSSRIRVSGLVVSGARVGLTAVRGSDYEIIGNRFDGVRSDGINLTQVQRVRIAGNACVNFTPIPQVYDAKGKLLVDGDHADCIQGWTTPGTAPLADIEIAGNTAIGNMQGISFFNAGQGGYDRITIRGNDLTLAMWHGIAVYEGRATTIIGNRVRTLPGAKAASYPHQRIVTWITAPGSVGRFCGNAVEAQPKGFGTGACS